MSEDRWADARRLEAWAGEVRVNLIRASALVVFYAHHLVNVYGWRRGDTSLGGAYHVAVTGIVIAWTAVVFVLHTCLSRRWVPPALKYVATFVDLALVTALLMAPQPVRPDNPGGPHSALVVLYFLVIAASPLRLSLRLVQVTTFGAMIAAAALMGWYVFFRVGRAAYYAEGSPYRISHTAEIIFLLALGTAGLLAGQSVRQARRLVEGYPVAVEEPKEGD